MNTHDAATALQQLATGLEGSARVGLDAEGFGAVARTAAAGMREIARRLAAPASHDAQQSVEAKELRRQLDREESDHGRTIGQRDAAEDALSRMFQAATGRQAEWSSAWGYVDAIEEVEEHVAAVAQQPAVVGDGVGGLLENADRVTELANRLVASGPKASHVSCSETHEIAEFVHAAIAVLAALTPAATPVPDGGGQAGPVAWTNDSAIRLAKHGGVLMTWSNPMPSDVPLYTHPPEQSRAVAGVPDGWKLVPVEPTREMIMAGGYLNPAIRKTADGVYDAMLAAAPTPPAADADGGAE